LFDHQLLENGSMLDNQSRDAKKVAGDRKTDVRIRDNAPDPQAALPPGTLKGPFLDRQGDEQRQPSRKERRDLAEIQTRQNGGGKT
jgi:hypothetical protein